MRLSDYLREHGLTQSEFARRAGITQAAVSYLVNGERVPGGRIIRAVSVATSGMVGLDDLMPVGKRHG